MHINDLLKIAVTSGASDLHLKVGSYPMMRVNGSLVVVTEDKRLDRPDTESMAQAVFSADHLDKFRKSQEVDLAYSIAGLGRFRVNVFQQRGTVGIVLRVIPTRIKTVDELGLPPVLKRIASEERGLVLVTGTTGSGKSTTLAAMIDYINARHPHHDGRGSDRVSAPRPSFDRQPARGRGRHQVLLASAAERPAAGSGRDPRGRDARLRDG
jgi:twitching motility protein PilT